MKLINKHIFIGLSLIIINFITIYTMREEDQTSEFKYKNFDEWYKVCEQLPYYQNVGDNYRNKAIQADELNTAIEKFVQIHANGELGNGKNWINGVPKVIPKQNLGNGKDWIDDAPEKDSDFFTTKKPLSSPIMPFVQKLIVNSNAEISFHGDFHGDIHSLVKYIRWLNDNGFMDGFKIIKPNFYIVTLGDYADRGNYGSEVWYTLMRLKIENPDQFIIVRGNHEDMEMNERYGFAHELEQKFPNESNMLSKIARIYDLVPVALYLGCESDDNLINYLLCIHGGLQDTLREFIIRKPNPPTALERIIGFFTEIDSGSTKIIKKAITNLAIEFQSEPILSDERKLAFQWYKESYYFGIPLFPPKIDDIGLLWNDFNVKPKTKTTITRGEDGPYLSFSKKDTIEYLNNISNPQKKYIVRAIFRAHQHSSDQRDIMMKSIINEGKGVSRIWSDDTNQNKSIWDGMVATFLVSPDTAYGKNHGYTYDAFGILTMSDKFEDWKLEVIKNHDVIPLPKSIVKG